MARVNITQAAKLVGITRSYLYTKYINHGLITVQQDSNGKKFVDTSELLRVFGELQDTESVDTQDNTGQQENNTDRTALNTLQTENERLKAELEKQQMLNARTEREAQQREALLRDEFNSRESWYQKQIERHQDEIKLLTDQSQKPVKSWWQWWK